MMPSLVIVRLVALLMLLGVAVRTQAVTLAWDPSPDHVDGYRVYAGTNRVAGLTNALVRVDAGTNLTVTFRDLPAGRWYFVATAYAASTNGTNRVTLESLPSNEVAVEIPPAPPHLRTVELQWSGSVAATNWQDAGFFRVKFGP